MLVGKAKKGHISELVAYAGVFLGAEIKAEGSIETDDDIMIDCNFKGDITTSGAIEIGKNSNLTGSIKARSILIDGYVEGDIMAEEEINLAACGQFKGRAVTNRFSCGTGASLKAKVETSTKN